MKQHSTAYENTKIKKRDIIIKHGHRLFGSVQNNSDTEWTEAPSLRLPVSFTCFIWTFDCQLQEINTNETYHIGLEYLEVNDIYFFFISKHLACFK